MIEVTDELKEAFFDRDNYRNLVIEFNDANNTSIDVSDILAGSFSLQQTLSTEDQINFGQVSSASFEVTTIKSAFEYKGLECTLTMYAGDYSIQLGKFKIAEDVLSDNRLQRKLTAYDALYEKLNTDVSTWYDGLTFPMTLKEFRDSLFSYIGIEQVTIDLPNDSITIEQAIDTSATALNFKTVINQICEINACMGCLNYEGKFRYIFFNQFGRSYPSDDIFPSDDLYPSDGVSEVISTSGEGALIQQGSYVYKGYMCERISKVIIRENSSDTGASYGDGTNVYTIEGNIFCLGNSATKNRQIAKNFYNVAFDSTYKPAKVTTQVLPWLEPGDIIEVVGNGGVTSVFPILDRTMSGIVSATDSYLANGSEKRTENVNSFSTQLKQVKSQTLTLSADVSQVKSQLNVIADDYVTSAVMQQSIEGASAEIELSVENSYSKKAEIIANINGTQQSEIQISADKISLEGAISANGTFKIDTAGNMQCTSGKLGNWNISNYGLYNDSAEVGFLIGANNFFAFYGGVTYAQAKAAIDGGHDVTGNFFLDKNGNFTTKNHIVATAGISTAGELYGATVKAGNGATGTIFQNNPNGGIKIANGIVTSWNLAGASGTILQDNPWGGITVKNGLITEWNISGYSGTITYGGLQLVFTQGMLTSVS